MCRNRSGRPRSCTRAPTDRIAPAPAVSLPTRVGAGRSLRSANAARIDDDPAAPPRNRYSGAGDPAGHITSAREPRTAVTATPTIITAAVPAAFHLAGRSRVVTI